MKALEYFLKPTQYQLFKMLCNMFNDKKIYKCNNEFILVEGEVPIMLLAHLDTVHKEPVRDICMTKDKNILMSPQGIGGDDRCGVYALVNAYELSVKKPWLLFTCNEEVGGIGAHYFSKVYKNGKLPKGLNDLKCLIEIDRKGSNDAVYYDCANEEFEKYITSKGFKTDYGSFSDISVIAPELGVAAVNLSSGYYNAHTLSEYINRAELDAVLYKLVEIISDVQKKDFPKYDYIDAIYDYSILKDWWNYSYDLKKDSVKKKSSIKVFEEPIPKQMPPEYEDFYYELVDEYGYTIDELEYLRESYGDKVIYELYINETQPFYQNTEDGMTITNIAEK